MKEMILNLRQENGTLSMIIKRQVMVYEGKLSIT